MKEYIGDSIYADIDEQFVLTLTTENGYGASNTIIIEPEFWDRLVDFMNRAEQ